MKTFYEIINEAETKSKPSIFSHTIYRLPTEDELKEVDSCKLSAKEIVNGFGYTIIGRGIKSSKNSQMIKQSVKMLSDLFPENQEYKKAIDLSQNV